MNNNNNFRVNEFEDFESVYQAIERNIDDEAGKDYSTLRDIVIRHNRSVTRSRFSLEGPAVLFIKDYGLKITYSKQNGSVLKVEQVNPNYINDAWFVAEINQPIELRIKKVQLQFNGSAFELVATRQCKTILPNLEMVETNEEFASFQFDLIRKKTSFFGESYGWKGLQNAGLGDFDELITKKGCFFTQSDKECFMLVKEAMDINSEIAKIAEELNLLKVCETGLSNLVMVMYQYISNESIKVLLNSEVGFYLLKKFNDEMKYQYRKMEEQFKQLFHSGTNLLDILGIEEKDQALFSQLMNKETRFYAEWDSYIKRHTRQERKSYFGFAEML